MPRCFENGNVDFGPEAFRAIHCAQLSTNGFHGSRRFIFTGSWSATHVLLSFVFFYEKQAIRRRQFAAIDCDVFMCGSYRIAGSELPRGLGAYVSPYLYSVKTIYGTF